MKTTILRLCTAVTVLVSFAGCNSDPPITPNDSVFAPPPQITGFEITSAEGWECGYWGILDEQRGDKGLLRLSPPYPNPSSGGMRLHCDNAVALTVSIWVVRGVGPSEQVDDTPGCSTDAQVVGSNKPIVVVRDRTILPGMNFFFWDGRDNSGSEVPGGFYRVYCQAGDKLYWVDALRMTPGLWDEIPEIRDILGHCH